MPNQVPRCAKIRSRSMQKRSRKVTVSDVGGRTKRQKVPISPRPKTPDKLTTHQGGCHVKRSPQF